MKKSNKEDAVSPVIGVMLMLVVTIIIAAVVAAFATGLGGDVDMAPTAALDVTVYSDGKVKITHLSGEQLVTKDIDVKLQKADGTSIASKGLEEGTYNGVHFAPGTTTTIASGAAADAVKADSYVTVVITAEGKYVVLSKEVMVKAASA